MSSKKHISKKETNQLIQAQLAEGKSKQAVFEDLSAQYYDADIIARLIAATPDLELKRKYKVLNTVLLVLLIVTAILKVLLVLPLIIEMPLVGLITAFFVPLLNVIFSVEVARMRGPIYRVLGMLAIVGLLKSFADVEIDPLFGGLGLLLLLSIAGLSFYLGNALFPKYGFSGPKKKADGSYDF